MRRDVVDRLADGRDLLGVLVRDLDPELVLELHDQLDEIERVRIEVLLERGLLRDIRLLDPELLGQDFLDSLEDFLARRCHVTSLICGGQEIAHDHTTSVCPTCFAAVRRAPRRPQTSFSTPRAASRTAFAIAVREELPCAITARPRRPSRYAPPYVSGSSRSRSPRAAGRIRRPPTLPRRLAVISSRSALRTLRIVPSSVF